jgi:tetratricopeptide (TPR) repeat protein
MRYVVVAAGSLLIGLLVGTFVVAPLISGGHTAAVAASPPSSADPFDALIAGGNHAMDQKQYPRAVEAYDRALAMRFDANVATDRGVCLRLAGDRDRALSTFDFVLLKDPEHWQARYNRAVVLMEMKRLDAARADADALLAARPGDPGIQSLRKAIDQAEHSSR